MYLEKMVIKVKYSEYLNEEDFKEGFVSNGVLKWCCKIVDYKQKREGYQ
jgi:hypothetical protein